MILSTRSCSCIRLNRFTVVRLRFVKSSLNPELSNTKPCARTYRRICTDFCFFVLADKLPHVLPLDAFVHFCSTLSLWFLSKLAASALESLNSTWPATSSSTKLPRSLSTDKYKFHLEAHEPRSWFDAGRQLFAHSATFWLPFQADRIFWGSRFRLAAFERRWWLPDWKDSGSFGATQNLMAKNASSAHPILQCCSHGRRRQF